MSTRATVLLAVLFAALAGAYFLTGHLQQRAAQQAEQAKRVFDFDPEDVVSLSIKRVNEPTNEAMRTADNSWKIIHPADTIPPNHVVLNRIAAAAANLANQRTITENANEVDLVEYELHEPFLDVIVGTNSGDVHQIEVGMLAATQDNRYARVGNKLLLIPQRAVAELDRPLNDLRERHIILPGEDGITKIEYVRVYTGGDEASGVEGPQIGDESVRIVVERNEENRWRMTSPVNAPTNQERVQALATELQFMVGRNYIDNPEHLGDYGLNPPGAKITLHGDRSGEPRTLMLGWVVAGEEDGGLYAKMAGNPAVFQIDGYILSVLPETPDALRDTRLFTGNAADLQQIHLQAGDAQWTLANDPDDGWSLVEPEGVDTDQQAVNRFITFLKNLHGASFPPAEEAVGLDVPSTRLTLTFKTGETREIRVGGPVPNTNPILLYAQQDFGDVTALPITMATALREDAFRFRDKHLLPFQPADATSLSLQFDGVDYAFERNENNWVVTAPPGARLDTRSDVNALLRTLAQAQATGLADPAPARDVQGVDDPLLTATVQVAGDDDNPQTVGPLRVGALKAASARERFATVADTNETYFVEQALLDDIREILRGVRIPTTP